VEIGIDSMIIEILAAIAVVLAFAATAATAVSAVVGRSAERRAPCVTALQEPRIGGRTGPRATCVHDNAILECATGRPA